MTTTPEEPTAGEQDDDTSTTPAATEKPGAEVGMVEGEGSTFEPEEDPGP